ncbi:Vacuolar protein sorting-associated protein 52 homolog [Caenorhabditis elegans]|uniref:Vacuolar protein sorting-associated protein 52 homolog n=1 Tax=Caenorhabditis elegans TaxID=6239 RepID=VPS52_CAEEL|nr:Vacuolar protein sorting-associated protein 52 homolog [Caenorhabditis elegans]G5EFV8.2 RecName: Full=Vacuolar protein sorting-associated protein 52 homolog [Caenorhabditis elegans]CCD67346.2 Vacuolar protein sorting-associated protein 52 homolog [Caenorhabditis elegans]|eukprot:NP_509282.4 Vacuolar protein sorting-associated protein 52 homolog [Caenorhabditis elegans]
MPRTRVNLQKSEANDRSFTISSLEFCLSQLRKADPNLVKKAIASGDGLTESKNDVSTRLSEAHRYSVQQCLDNSEQLAQLHNQLVHCDNVFERLQATLYSFQDNLGSIGQDMKNLQLQSHHIHQELENRQKVRVELSQFVDDIAVSQTMMKTINDTDANDRGFLEALHELHHKITLILQRGNGDAVAVNDTMPILEGLKLKAVVKVREWLLQKMFQFRKPLSNYQVFQHQLLKCRFFYEFLLHHDLISAKELQDEYIDTISKMFFTYFKAYATRLFKLAMKDVATKEDALGSIDFAKPAGLGAIFSSKQHVVRNKATVFSIGQRHQILSDDFLGALIVPHAATQNHQSYQFEALFRSIQLAFVDHYSHEYLFITDFFLVSNDEAIELHNKAMARAMSVVLKSCEEQIALSWDAISLHLCICLCDKFTEVLAEREVPEVSDYWNTVTSFLWTRLNLVMSQHYESVKSVDLKKLMHSGSLDARPHFIVRRYAELTSAHLMIAKASGKEMGAKMEAVLENSEDSIEQLLTRMSAMQQTQKNKHVFLINNYDLILSIIDNEESKHTKIYAIVHELEQKSIDDFVEEMLEPHIGYMIKFVNECESLIVQGHTQLLVRYNDKVGTVVANFNAKWRPAVDSINSECIQLFTNFSLGTTILQTIFTKYVQYINRFTKILSHDVFAKNPVCSQLVNVHQVMLEIKRFKPAY